MTRLVTLAAVLLTIAAWLALDRVHAQDGTPPAQECAVYVSQDGDALTFGGTGDVVTEPFAVEVGALIVSATFDGEGTFAARIVDLDRGGSAPGPLIAGPGSAQDAIPIVYAAERVVLDIDAPEAGAWTVTVEQA